ncbi:MAG: hypothetical protein LBB77_02565, partial [Treponema sp.]|nr:hypothetical protein [Treponema sp.]
TPNTPGTPAANANTSASTPNTPGVPDAPAPGPPKHAETVAILTETLGLILSITSTVYSCLENSFDLEGKPGKKIRDNIHICAMTIDNSLITVVTGILCGLGLTSLASAQITIGADGSINLDADENNVVYCKNLNRVATPSSAFFMIPYKLKMLTKVVDIGRTITEYGVGVASLTKKINYESRDKELEEDIKAKEL